MHLTRLAHAAASTTHAAHPQHIAILGGGISGLSAAHFLRRRLAAATPPHPFKITLIDRAPRLGGWIQSDVDPATGVLLESGPRTLRPKGLPGALTLAMIHDLGLADQVVTVPTTSPSAKIRQMLFQDRVQQLPMSLGDVLKASSDAGSPMSGIVPTAVKEMFTGRRAAHVKDETIAAFLSRRFSPALVNNLVSGIVHGIYAGNAHQLSVRATFPSLWNAERDHGSVVLGVLKGAMSAASAEDRKALDELVQGRGPAFADLWAAASGASIYSVRGGLEAIVRELEASLKDNVDMRLGSDPVAIRLPAQPAAGGIQVALADGSTIVADRLISTIPTPALHSLLDPAASTASPALAHLASTITPSAVTVALTNIVFRTRDLPRAVLDRTLAFGVLSPLAKGSRTHPHLLGIIYDSAAVPGLAEHEFTKFTVMMGGHYYSTPGVAVPTADEAGALALDAVRRHLAIPEWVATPVVVRPRVHAACIPQYGVGHVCGVAAARDEMRASGVELVGAWYDGVGVNDCVRSAWEAAWRVRV